MLHFTTYFWISASNSVIFFVFASLLFSAAIIFLSSFRTYSGMPSSALRSVEMMSGDNSVPLPGGSYIVEEPPVTEVSWGVSTTNGSSPFWLLLLGRLWERGELLGGVKSASSLSSFSSSCLRVGWATRVWNLDWVGIDWSLSASSIIFFRFWEGVGSDLGVSGNVESKDLFRGVVGMYEPSWGIVCDCKALLLAAEDGDGEVRFCSQWSWSAQSVAGTIRVNSRKKDGQHTEEIAMILVIPIFSAAVELTWL